MRTSPSALRSLCALLSSALLAVLLVAVGVPQEADDLAPAYGSTYLCSGYSGCAEAGYGNAGYAAVSDRSFWNMYPGHNCTNYVAYRMIKAGMSSDRPFGYPGNATNWGGYMADITDNKPAVGAVAWWKAYDNGSGSAGHVAVVEKVASDHIIISEDSWGGTFHWRKISTTSNRWPTGFIHFIDRVIENKASPVIEGTPQYAQQLRVTPGSWSPTDANIKYKWFVDGERDKDAKEPTYDLKKRHIGAQVRAKVVVKKSGWQKGVATTAATAAVQPGDIAVVTAPSVKGKTLKGKKLKARLGSFSPEPDSLRLQWLADGTPIKGATDRKLELTNAEVGAHISLRVTAEKDAYADETVVTAATDWIRKGRVKVKRDGQIKGKAKVGGKLKAVPGKTKPKSGRVEASYQWLRDGAPIEGATGRVYRPTADDFRRDISVRITHSHPKRYAATEELASNPVRVRTRMTTEAKTKGRKGQKVVIKVWVEPREVETTAQGDVAVEFDGQIKTKRLEDGFVKVAFKRVEFGKYKARVVQQQSKHFKGSRDQVTVKVRKP